MKSEADEGTGEETNKMGRHSFVACGTFLGVSLAPTSSLTDLAEPLLGQDFFSFPHLLSRLVSIQLAPQG